MPGRPYILAETTWKQVRDAKFDVAVLPWGATEAHNYHLPYATDTIQVDYIAAEAARLAWEEGARVVVLPAIPFGVQTGQMDIPLCMNLNPITEALMLSDLAKSLDGHGIAKLLILNGHGGNDFRQIIRELQPQLKLFLCTASWYKIVDPRPFFNVAGDHAGELETSVTMHIAPTLVLPLTEAGAGHERRPRIDAFRDGWAWTPRPWTQISADTGAGDPSASTAQKGSAYAEAVTKKIGRFLVELAAADAKQMYEK